MRRMNSKHLASYKDDNDTCDDERVGVAAPERRPLSQRPHPRSRPARRPPRPAIDSLVGVVIEEAGAALSVEVVQWLGL
jgi:hypothetical protein